METWSAATLPCGWWRENHLHRATLVRPLTGEDEEALLDRDAMSVPARTSALIARCVRPAHATAAFTEEDASQLTLGDREALVLRLRGLTFGERLQCIVQCPACETAMDLDLAIGNLLLAPYSAPAPGYEDSIAGLDGDWRIRYRLPNGADQIAVIRTSANDVNRAARELVSRCVLDVGSPAGASSDPDALPDEIADALGERMAALDPQAEIALEFNCSACTTRSSAILDAAELFFRELAVHERTFYREVHHLALHYHWSERDILALPQRKRRRYLALLVESGVADI